MRIGIVNDLPIAVEALRRVVASSGLHEIAWVAFDGAQAVEKCSADIPDIILMDLLMPVMDGVEATRLIMQRSPCPILVVTATVTGNASKVFDAMSHGALDAVNTPILGTSGGIEGGSSLLSKIEIIAKLTGKYSWKDSQNRISHENAPAKRGILAIAASTGGPLVIAKILRGLPVRLPVPVVLLQHVDAEFAPGLAEWLEDEVQIPIRLIRSGDQPEHHTILLAGTNDHLVLTASGSLIYQQEPKDHPYRPSADVFFQSLAQHWNGPGAAVLLTGMGRDGAAGLLALKNKGWLTIAQDKETSIVYGMPKAAAELKAADRILPDHQIAANLTEWTMEIECRTKPL